MKRQRELQNAEKKRLGNAYTDLNLIFATKTGQILERPHVAQTLALIRKQMRIIRAEELHKDISEVEEPNFTLHSLRHTFATRALEQDIPLKVVSDWLGHTTIRITGDIYSHALPAKRRNSIQRLTGITTDHYKNGQNRGPVSYTHLDVYKRQAFPQNFLMLRIFLNSFHVNNSIVYPLSPE